MSAASDDDVEITREMVEEDEAYMDDEVVAPSPRKVPGDAADVASKTDDEIRLALDKVLTVAQRMSDFYSATESIIGEGSSKRLPKGFTGQLYDYQKKGLDWLVKLHDNGTSGILADEMGLGKTVQVISFICHMLEHGSGPALIVAPLAVLSNWVREFQKFAPSVKICRYYGTQEHRAELRDTYINRARGAKLPVFITTFQIAMNDRKFLAPLQWNFLCVDEGHRMKNINSRLKQELTHYTSHEDGQSGIVVTRLLLTGTPLQNNLDELWSLCNFVLPAVFSSLSMFKRWFNFERLSELEGQEAVVEQQRKDQIVSKLHSILAPFLLRRVKEEVIGSDPKLSIPPKVEVIVYVGMSREQTRLYEAITSGRIREELADMGWTADGTVEPAKSTTDRSSRLSNKMAQARKLCCHPFLFGEPVRRDSDDHTDERIVSMCGKLQTLDRMCKELKARGHRVLIFSQFVRVLEILEDYFRYRSNVYGEDAVRVYHGGMGPEEKDIAIAEFQFAFLISTKAGGLGMNLTSADTVIIYDGDWNPHGDAQAQDRVHRFGQEKPVVVYRLVTAESVEVHLVRTADAKRSLEKLVLNAKAAARTPAPTPDAAATTSKRRRRGEPSPAAKPADAPAAPPADVDDAIPEDALRALLRPEFDHERMGSSSIGSGELALILDREKAMAAGLRVRAEVEASLSSSASVNGAAAAAGTASSPKPLSPQPVAAAATKKRGRGSSTPTAVADPVAAVAAPSTIPTCGEGYQFVYRKTSSLVGSVSMDGDDA